MITINNRLICENCFSEIVTEPCFFCGFSKQDYRQDPLALAMGSKLSDRYLIGGVIGKGGFGITYLGYDLRLNTRIAVKEYYPVGMAVRVPGATHVSISNKKSERPFKEGAEKFYNEANIVASFNGNPNIVSVYDFFYENDTVYFVMGYLQGQTLKSYIRSQLISEGQAVKIMLDVSNALLAVHSKNILHRDISPDNIMLCDDNTVKLLDFGAARQLIADQSQGLSVILKQGFAPLEQYQKKGNQGPWTDIYALGASVYNALTGEVMDDPMTRLGDDSQFSANKHGISADLWKIIRKSTMLNISDRYQDINEFRSDLIKLNIEPELIDSIGNHSNGDYLKPIITYENQNDDYNATELLVDIPVSNYDGETVVLSTDDANAYLNPTSVRRLDDEIEKAINNIENGGIREVEDAIRLLKKKDGLPDAKEHISRGRKRIRALRVAEKRKKRNITIVCAGIAVIVSIIAILVGIKTIRGGRVNAKLEDSDISLDDSLPERIEVSFPDDGTESYKKYAEGVALFNDGNYYDAFYCFNEVSGYQDADFQMDNCKTSMIQNAEIDSTIIMGEYDIAGKGEQPMEWIVIDKADSRLLIYSKVCIDKLPFLSSISSRCDWEISYIRKWLNSDFLNSFTNEDVSCIVESRLDNSCKKETEHTLYYGDYVLTGSSNTVDKIFILSRDEVFKYCSGKEFAKNTYNGLPTDVWYRSPIIEYEEKTYALASGSIICSPSTMNAIRAAMWIDRNNYSYREKK